jgi:hypothetical protein
MAISAGKSAPILHLIRKPTKGMRCTNTSVAAVAQVSTETLDVLVGLCAGQGPHFVSSERTWQSFSEVCLIPKVTLVLVMRETGQQKSGSSITGEITGELFIVSL